MERDIALVVEAIENKQDPPLRASGMIVRFVTGRKSLSVTKAQTPFGGAPFLDNNSTSIRIDEGLAQTLLLKCIVRPIVRSTNSGVAEVAAFFARLSTDRLSTW